MVDIVPARAVSAAPALNKLELLRLMLELLLCHGGVSQLAHGDGSTNASGASPNRGRNISAGGGVRAPALAETAAIAPVVVCIATAHAVFAAPAPEGDCIGMIAVSGVRRASASPTLRRASSCRVRSNHASCGVLPPVAAAFGEPAPAGCAAPARAAEKISQCRL